MNMPVSTNKPPIPFNRRRPLSVLLLDISGSMESGEPPRIDVLWQAVQTLYASGKSSRTPQTPWKMAVFSSDCHWKTLEEKPRPYGTTNLAKAFQHVGQVPLTRLTLVTDGDPDDMDAAHRAGIALGISISIMFAGDETDETAMAFCQRLCLQTRGIFAREALSLAQMPAVAATMQRMLGTGTGPSHSIVLGA